MEVLYTRTISRRNKCLLGDKGSIKNFVFHVLGEGLFISEVKLRDGKFI